MRKSRHTWFVLIVLLMAIAVPSAPISAGHAHSVEAPATLGVNLVSGWPVARLRLGRSRLKRGWSTPSQAHSGPAEVQSPARYTNGSVPLQKSNKFMSLGRAIFWLFCLGSLGGVLFFLVALVFALLKLRPQRYRIR